MFCASQREERATRPIPFRRTLPALLEGYVPWIGGGRPVPISTRVDAQFASGRTRTSYPAGDLNWNWRNQDGDIIAWRPAVVPAVPDVLPSGWTRHDPATATNPAGDQEVDVMTREGRFHIGWPANYQNWRLNGGAESGRDYIAWRLSRDPGARRSSVQTDPHADPVVTWRAFDGTETSLAPVPADTRVDVIQRDGQMHLGYRPRALVWNTVGYDRYCAAYWRPTVMTEGVQHPGATVDPAGIPRPDRPAPAPAPTPTPPPPAAILIPTPVAAPVAGADGWIPYSGTVNPAGEQQVDVRHADGRFSIGWPAHVIENVWARTYGSADAWRPSRSPGAMLSCMRTAADPHPDPVPIPPRETVVHLDEFARDAIIARMTSAEMPVGLAQMISRSLRDADNTAFTSWLSQHRAAHAAAQSDE